MEGFFLRLNIYTERERMKEKEKEGEKILKVHLFLVQDERGDLL